MVDTTTAYIRYKCPALPNRSYKLSLWREAVLPGQTYLFWQCTDLYSFHMRTGFKARSPLQPYRTET